MVFQPNMVIIGFDPSPFEMDLDEITWNFGGWIYIVGFGI